MIADEEMFMGKQRFADQDMLGFTNKYSKERQKQEYVVKGRSNPINDLGGNEIIKPINLKDFKGNIVDDGDVQNDDNNNIDNVNEKP